MSKLGDLLYGNLEAVDNYLEHESASEQELRCAIQNVCRVVQHLEKKLAEQERQIRNLSGRE